jgi:hypothetical protein
MMQYINVLGILQHPLQRSMDYKRKYLFYMFPARQSRVTPRRPAYGLPGQEQVWFKDQSHRGVLWENVNTCRPTLITLQLIMGHSSNVHFSMLPATAPGELQFSDSFLLMWCDGWFFCNILVLTHKMARAESRNWKMNVEFLRKNQLKNYIFN